MILLNIVDKNIKISDINAGDEALSFPLVPKYCSVMAHEPSEYMHKFIDLKRFEELNPSETSQFCFTLAYNSLHLIENAIEKSIFKIFNSDIENASLVIEKIFSFDLISQLYPEYKSYICESSFAYHSLEEVFEHWEFKLKKASQLEEIDLSLIYDKYF
ncbi:MAG: hypothetical protein ABDH19_01815 [Thermodesulfovibrio sp.]